MRVANALKSDMTFQARQGFYYVYILVTLVYMAVMTKLPESFKPIAVSLTVFSDPSLLGFFFIGGIVMLEKVQGVFRYLAVTPLDAREYLMAKAGSLTLVALAAGSAITLVCYRGNVNWFYMIASILLSSVFFTLYGFIVAAKARTINQYFINMVPYLLIIILPCFTVIGFPGSFLFNIFPSVAGLKLVMGAFTGLPVVTALLYMVVLLVMDVLILRLAAKTYMNMAVSEEA